MSDYVVIRIKASINMLLHLTLSPVERTLSDVKKKDINVNVYSFI